jgi:hypothetical protein
MWVVMMDLGLRVVVMTWLLLVWLGTMGCGDVDADAALSRDTSSDVGV